MMPRVPSLLLLFHVRQGKSLTRETAIEAWFNALEMLHVGSLQLKLPFPRPRAYQNLTVIYCKWLCLQCETGFNDSQSMGYWWFMSIIMRWIWFTVMRDISGRMTPYSRWRRRTGSDRKRFLDKKKFLFNFNCLRESADAQSSTRITLILWARNDSWIIEFKA